MGKVVERDSGGEHDARQPRRRQQLRESALGLSRLQWNAVKQQFVIRYTQQEAGITGLGQSLLQFAPRHLELSFGALMGYPIKPRVLNEDVQAVKESASRCTSAGVGLDIGSDSTASSPVWSVANKPMRESDLMHDYGGN